MSLFAKPLVLSGLSSIQWKDQPRVRPHWWPREGVGVTLVSETDKAKARGIAEEPMYGDLV